MQITIELTNDEYKAIADHVIDPEEWILHAAKNKARRCINRIIEKETNRLIHDPTVDTMPATQDTLLDSYFDQLSYKTRAESEESGSVRIGV